MSILSNVTKLCISLTVTILLAGCGGGGSSTPSPPTSSPYVGWQGSSNGEIILDAASRQFKVNGYTRIVFDMATPMGLTGLTVDTSGNVLYNGAVIGTVALITSGANNIAIFACSNGTRMTISVNSTAMTWNYSCGSSPNTSGTGGTVLVTLPINLNITPLSPSVNIGSTTQLAVTATDVSGKPIATPSNLKWSSSNTAAATVDATGLVTGVLGGTSIITVTDPVSGTTGSNTIQVNEADLFGVWQGSWNFASVGANNAVSETLTLNNDWSFSTSKLSNLTIANPPSTVAAACSFAGTCTADGKTLTCNVTNSIQQPSNQASLSCPTSSTTVAYSYSLSSRPSLVGTALSIPATTGLKIFTKQ